ncbi:SDR family oxidoreductase [Frondihabitans cladoniiphilus]|uniref:SDR family oxidoreductase n=1 Tax=Frondihabitans cladoniiphilus TaxID=715785 RepID=A0ABP8VQ16_9MICO
MHADDVLPLSDPPAPDLPLGGRVAVVTGVGRRRGIGFAIASRLLGMGASVLVQHWAPHDEAQPWGSDPIEEVVAALRESAVAGARVEETSVDFAAAEGASHLIARGVAAFGHLDVLVCNHALSGDDGDLASMTAERLDHHWQVNTRSTLLATRDFAAQHDGRPGGRVIWMTSGQTQGPMPSEIAYATSKAALAGVTPSVAAWLAPQGILLNTVNPGPVNTGYLDLVGGDRPSDVVESLVARFPGGRFGEPDDPARLIAWLVSDEGRWMVGQVLSTEGGFRRG